MSDSRERLRMLRGFALVVAAGVVLAACGPASTQGNLAKDQILRLSTTTEPASLDPGQTQYVYEAAIARNNFEALVIPKADLSDVQAATAESWTTTADGLTWTFKIRKNAKWSDGQPVRAQDFVYSWQRVLDPRLEAPYADPFFTEAIKGGDGYAKLDPKKDAAKIDDFIKNLGLKAQDDSTFVVSLQKPAPYFKWIASLWMAAPIRKDIVDKYGSDKWAQKPESLIGNGAFKVSEIVPKDHITLVANDNYWGGKPTLTKIVIDQIADDNQAFAKYQNGEHDLGRVPLANSDLVRTDAKLSKELVVTPSLSMFWIQVNTKKQPFDNPKVRLAFAQAVDRDKLVKDVLRGRAVASTTFIPKGMNGYHPEIGDPQNFNPTKAKADLDASGVNKDLLKDIHFLVRNTTSAKQIAEFLADQYKTNLGIDLKLEVIESKTVSQRLRKGDFQIQGTAGWIADYPDEQDWFDIFTTGSGNQFSGYSSSEFDRLIKLADVEKDLTKREDLYLQAHKILVKDAPVFFVDQGVGWTLKKPWVQGIQQTPIDDWLGDFFTNKISIAQH